eukprot:Hpha_TRINITY_DN8104_c0_g1::TRINITY_DN8104_c0_g1_i1::g.172074::m.172074
MLAVVCSVLLAAALNGKVKPPRVVRRELEGSGFHLSLTTVLRAEHAAAGCKTVLCQDIGAEFFVDEWEIQRNADFTGTHFVSLRRGGSKHSQYLEMSHGGVSEEWGAATLCVAAGAREGGLFRTEVPVHVRYPRALPGGGREKVCLGPAVGYVECPGEGGADPGEGPPLQSRIGE